MNIIEGLGKKMFVIRQRAIQFVRAFGKYAHTEFNSESGHLENLCNRSTFCPKPAVEPGQAMSDYARDIVALGEMKHQAAVLSEPQG
jgi:hypothetical protein